MPHTTDNGLQIAISEAKKMQEKCCYHWEYGEWYMFAINEFIQSLEARAEVATEDDGWIDIRLQEPIDTQRVIVPNDEWTIVEYENWLFWTSDTSCYRLWEVKLWQPLPLPPKN